MKPILHTWCPRAHLPIANCAVLVLSRQSTQFVRTTPVCKHPHSVLWPWKPLYLQIKAVIFFHFFYSNLPKRQIQIHKPLKKRLDYLQDIFLTMNLLTIGTLYLLRCIPEFFADMPWHVDIQACLFDTLLSYLRQPYQHILCFAGKKRQSL